MSKIILLGFLIFGFSLHAQTQEFAVKNGKQYATDLGRRLDWPPDEMGRLFRMLKNNVPKTSGFGELAANADGFVKMAVEACQMANLWATDYPDANSVYRALLDRDATELEKQVAVKDLDGQFVFFPNCIQVAMHLDFLKRGSP